MSPIAAKARTALPPQNRRKEARFTLILRVGMLEQRGKSLLCLVKNISPTGVQVKFYARPIIGAEASIQIADEPPVPGQVVWIKGDVAGISFQEQLDASTLLRVRQKLKPNRRRTMPRVTIEASATLRTGGKTHHARVCDISSLGARVRTRSTVTPGDRAVIAFPDLPPINGFVRWCDGEESGLAFETPIPIQIIAGWIDGRVRLSL